MAELRKTLYSSELQKLLFPDNSFYKKSIGEAGVADDVVKVEKPVQSAISEAEEGELPKLPIEVETSIDGTKYYETTLIYCKPLLVDSQSQLLTNYNKRQTKQEQQANELNTKAAGYILHKWLPTEQANILKTTGAGRASNISGFTSERKAVTKDDFLRVLNLTMRMNVGSLGGNWYGLVTADMYTDLLAIPDFVDYYKTGNESKLKEGIIGRICGIDILSRTVSAGHNGILYNAAGAPQPGRRSRARRRRRTNCCRVRCSGTTAWSAARKDVWGWRSTKTPRATWAARSSRHGAVSVRTSSAATRRESSPCWRTKPDGHGQVEEVGGALHRHARRQGGLLR